MGDSQGIKVNGIVQIRSGALYAVQLNTTIYFAFGVLFISI